MTNETCNTCTHYRQHYTFDQRKIFRVCCGHCTHPKAKTKKPYSRICESYQPATPNENAFVSKEYLSKALLQYLLNLELLPEIHDISDQALP